MITYHLQIIETQPHLYIEIPLDAYLLDDEKVTEAKQIMEGLEDIARGNTCLFINGDTVDGHARYETLKDIVEKYRSLYLLSLLEVVLDKVRPLNNPYIRDIDTKLRPLIDEKKALIKHSRSPF